MLEEVPISVAGGNVQKSPSSKAATNLTRGAYSEYVSTAKWRERRWRLFSTFPMEKSFLVYGRLRWRSNSGRQSPVGFFRIVHEDTNHQIQKERL